MARQIPSHVAVSPGLVGEVDTVEYWLLLSICTTYLKSIKKEHVHQTSPVSRILKEENLSLKGSFKGEYLHNHSLGNRFLDTALREQAIETNKR